MLMGERDAVTSAGAEVVRETVPANPFNPVMVIVEVLDEPAINISEEGPADMVKSTTFTGTTAE